MAEATVAGGGLDRRRWVLLWVIGLSPGSAPCADRRSHVARANRFIRVRREIHDHYQPTRRPGRLLPGRGPRPQPDRLRRDAARRPRRLRAAARPRGRAAAVEVLRTAVEL